MLRSSDYDPDVLVWDSRKREIEYEGGAVKTPAEVLSHTVLSKPGTRAVVVACDPLAVKPIYASGLLDVIGIRITTGPDRGHYGWVTADDVHVRSTAQASPP